MDKLDSVEGRLDVLVRGNSLTANHMSKKLHLCLNRVIFHQTKFESVVQVFWRRQLHHLHTRADSGCCKHLCVHHLEETETVFFLSNLNNPNSANNTVFIYHCPLLKPVRKPNCSTTLLCSSLIAFSTRGSGKAPLRVGLFHLQSSFVPQWHGSAGATGVPGNSDCQLYLEKTLYLCVQGGSYESKPVLRALPLGTGHFTTSLRLQPS